MEKKMYKSPMFRQLRPNAGQGLVEYIAITALVAVVSITAVKVFGNKVHGRLKQITNKVDRTIQTGLSGSRKGEVDSDSQPNGGKSGGMGGLVGKVLNSVTGGGEEE